jgi:hypothetical protein
LFCFWLLILWFLLAQDNKEDCAEASVSELQSLLSARDEGTCISPLFSTLDCFSLSVVSEFSLKSIFRGTSTLRSVETRRARELSRF